MFDAIINSIAQQFGLGEKAKPFVQMLLASMSDPSSGGLAGFVQRLRSGGIGSMVDNWIARPTEVAPIAPPVVEQTLGGEGGLISAMTSKLGFDRGTIVKALGFAIPTLISRIAQGGILPSALPAEAENFVGNRKIWQASPAASVPLAATAVAPSRAWLPWALAAVVAAVLLGYCASRKAPTPVVSTPAPVVATMPAPAVVEEPAGAAILGLMINGAPSMKVYFDTAKADIAPEFAGKAKALVDYLKSNATAVAVISGFNDPTGDPVANAALSKNRAKAVQDALVAAGVPVDKTMLEKPADTTGTGATNAASRRVDVVVRK